MNIVCATCGERFVSNVNVFDCPSCKAKFDAKIESIIVSSTTKPLGIKHDESKLEWSLLPLSEVEDVIKVLMHGKAKYSANNWKFVKPKERYIDAAFRHLAARAKGEILDSESKLPHLAHCVCCLLFLLWHDKEDANNA